MRPFAVSRRHALFGGGGALKLANPASMTKTREAKCHTPRPSHPLAATMAAAQSANSGMQELCGGATSLRV